MNAVRRRAQVMLDRMLPFEEWHPSEEVLAAFLPLFRCSTARELYDWTIADLKAEIAIPSPSSVEILADGTKRYGYGVHKEKPSVTSRKAKGPYKREASRPPLPPALIVHTPTARHHPHP